MYEAGEEDEEEESAMDDYKSKVEV